MSLSSFSASFEYLCYGSTAIINIYNGRREHGYSNKAERADYAINDDFKLKKPIWFLWFMHKYFSVVKVK